MGPNRIWKGTPFALALVGALLSGCEVPITFTITGVHASGDPSASPSAAPSGVPSAAPSAVPSATPTATPSAVPGAVGTVSDLRVVSSAADSLTLQFTEVADGLGQPAKYDIRFASPTMSWGAAASVTQGSCATPLLGSSVGAVKSCTIQGLQADTAYQIQLVAYRGTLNQDAVFGKLSNVASDRTDSAAVGSVSSSWSHEPSGLTVLTEKHWSELPTSGWDFYTYRSINGVKGNYLVESPADLTSNLSLVSDPTVPTGDPQVLQFFYPQGFNQGNGPALGSFQFSKDEIFVGFYWKISPNWQQHPANVGKIFYIFQRLNSDNRQACFLALTGPNGGPYHFSVANEPDSSWFRQNVNNVTIVPDRWYKVEMHLKRSSAEGAPDGTVEWWVDGVLAARYTDAKLRSERFSELHVAPVWGGYDPTQTIVKLHDDYQRFGLVRVSGR